MITQKFKLLKKTKLTHDIYELIFVSEEKLTVLPGQFITFMLISGLRRAYSIIESDGINFVFIIKRLDAGKGGSKEMCDMNEGTVVNLIGPIGNFIVRNNDKSKLFLGTGTGFAPLYSQIKYLLESDFTQRIHLSFGLRTKGDIFYEKQLLDLKSNYPNFTFDIFLSREDRFEYKKGYISTSLTLSGISNFNEFYICGSPKVVTDVKTRLENMGVKSDSIFFEQY